MIKQTTCDCCDDVTYHLAFSPEDVTFDGEQFHVHLTEDEATYWHLMLREKVLGLEVSV